MVGLAARLAAYRDGRSDGRAAEGIGLRTGWSRAWDSRLGLLSLLERVGAL